MLCQISREIQNFYKVTNFYGNLHFYITEPQPENPQIVWPYLSPPPHRENSGFYKQQPIDHKFYNNFEKNQASKR